MSDQPPQPPGTDPGPPPFPARLTEDQVRRLAAMVADGRADWPANLGPADMQRLRRETHRCLRARLMRAVALAVAHSLQPTLAPEAPDHARTPI